MSNIDVDTRDKAAAAGFPNPDERGADPRDEKKYSDNDLDKIIAKKIARERAKYENRSKIQGGADPIDQRALDLDIRERKLRAKETLSGTNLPNSYLELLKYDSDENYESSVAAVTQFVEDLLDMLAVERSKGTTPKQIRNEGTPDRTRSAFGL